MLKLIKLELQGFGIFKDKTSFEYSDGINVIKAENGKGKTTQIEAISTLLLSEYDGSFADYMNRDCDEFIISLEFMLDGKHLLETLNCKKGKTYTTTRNLKDLDTDQDIANGENVKDWLNERLPVATSKYALFVRQNSDMDIIHVSDSERRDLFKKIQDLDFSKEIDTLIAPKIETVKEKIIEVDKEIFALENKEYEVKSYGEFPFTEDEYKLKKSQLDKLNTEKSLVEEKKNQLKDLEERKNSLNDECINIDSKISTKKVSIINTKQFNFDTEKEKIEKEFTDKKIESENKIKSLEEQKKNIDKDINEKSLELESEIKKIEEEGQKLTEEIDSIRLMKLIKFDEESLIKARNDLAELKTKSSIAWKNAEQLKTGICPICGSSCTDKHAQFEDEAISLDKQIAECDGVIDDLVAKKSDIEEKTKQNEELKEKKNHLSNELLKKQSLIENKRTEQKSLNDSLLQKKENYINQIESEKRILESVDSEKESKLNSIKEKADLYSSQIESLEKEVNDLENQHNSKLKEMEELSKKIELFSVGTFDENKINKLEEELKSYDSVVAENKVVKEYNEHLEETKKADKVELEKFKEKKQKFEKEKFDLESAKVVMSKDYPNWVIVNSIQNIQDDINEFVDQVYYKPLNVKFDMTKTGISMRFGDDIKINRLSGAEKAITNIGFCESFNKNLDLNTILLDEPDSALSEARKQSFYESLLEMKNIFEQMIIVTHSEKMQSFIQANDTDCNIITL